MLVTTTRCCASRRADCAAPITSSSRASCFPGYRVRARPRIGRHHRGDRRACRDAMGRAARAIGSRSRCSCRAGECDACRAGAYRRARATGSATCTASCRSNARPGCGAGTRSTSTSRPTRCCCRVPATLDPVTATMFNPLGAGIRWAVTVPQTQPGDVVAVLGPGVRGLSACAAAKDAGAGLRDGHRHGRARRRTTRARARVRRRPRGRRRRRRSRRRTARGDRPAGRRRRRRDREGAGRARTSRAAARAGRHDRHRGHARRAARPRASIPTSSSTRSSASSARSVSTPRPTPPRSSCSRADGSRSPICRGESSDSTMSRRSYATWRAKGDMPPVHGVVVPDGPA